MNDIVDRVTDSLAVLESGLASRDEVVDALSFVGRLSEIARELKAKTEAAALEWIEVNGPIENGDKRWYVGRDKVTKCRDVAGTFRAILEATGGDVDEIATCFSTGAFKPSATMKMLGAKANDLFEVTTNPDLKLKAIDRKLTGKDENEDA